MYRLKMLKFGTALFLMTTALLPNSTFADHAKNGGGYGGHNKNGDDSINKNGGYNEFSILFNKSNSYRYKLNGYVALNIGASFQSQYQAQMQHQVQYQAQMQAQAQYQAQMQAQAQRQYSFSRPQRWRREMFYCLSTDFLSLTFGKYTNGSVTFNEGQLLECSEGEGIFLDSDGQMSCGRHQQSITHTTGMPLLYIHAAQILATKGECTSPKGHVSPALTLFSNISVHLQTKQRQAFYKGQYQTPTAYQGQAQSHYQSQYQAQLQSQGQYQNPVPNYGGSYPVPSQYPIGGQPQTGGPYLVPNQYPTGAQPQTGGPYLMPSQYPTGGQYPAPNQYPITGQYPSGGQNIILN